MNGKLMEITYMKKINLILLTMIVLSSLMGGVYAATTDAGEGVNSVTVTYVVSEGFTLVIPSAVTLGEKNVQIDVDDIHASNIVIADDAYLVVKVASTNLWNVVITSHNEGEEIADADKIGYKMHYKDLESELMTDTQSDDIPDNGDVLVFRHLSGSGPGSASLSFTRTGDAHKAGVFEDKLIFKVEVDEPDTP